MPTASNFDGRLAEHFTRLSPAEQRVARFFQENPEEVLIASAAALAIKTETSDATIVRTARALGYAGLEDLRRSLVGELRNPLSLAERLTRTLSETGGSVASAMDMTLEIHQRSLDNLRRSITGEQFEAAVEILVTAQRVAVFGLGPSSAIANYLVMQLGRFGFNAFGLTNTGLLFADDLGKLRAGDTVIMFAYGRVYAELAALVDMVERRGLRSVLITDTLEASLQAKIGLVLSVNRGRSDMFSMHTATLGFIEALLVGIATKRPAETVASLQALNDAREKLAGKPTKLSIVEPKG